MTVESELVRARETIAAIQHIANDGRPLTFDRLAAIRRQLARYYNNDPEKDQP